MSEVKRRLLECLVASFERSVERYQEETGRFLTEPDGPLAPGAKPEDLYWCPINQDIIYTLATLYREPGTRYTGDSAVLEMALRAGDAVRDFQYPDGQVEFIKADGSRWGPTYMGWTNYAWLEAYVLLRDEMAPERRRAWEEGLTLAHDGQARELQTAGVHNIPAWKAMSCYRAGEVFGRPDWQEAGRAMIRQVVEAQHPAGFWPEHGGPSTLYNLVYVHALGLYLVFSLDEAVLPALERATRFHEVFTYPDGTVMETVDGRVKYHGTISQFGLVSFSLFPHGRRYGRYLVNCLQPERDCKSVQGGLLATAYHHWLDGEEEAIPFDEPNVTIRYHDLAVVRRDGPWLVCLSGVTAPPAASRWGQDRQNLLSVWHEKTGLIIGGGNSKDQPEWSSFIAGGRFMPDRARLLPDGASVAYDCGGVYCLLEAEVTDEQVRVIALTEKGSAVQQLVLNLKRGTELRTGAGLSATTGDEAICWDTAALGGWLQVGAVRIETPHGARLRWPVTPFNPYAIDGAARHGEEMGVLSVNVDGKAVEWRVRVE